MQRILAATQNHIKLSHMVSTELPMQICFIKKLLAYATKIANSGKSEMFAFF